MIGEQLKYKLSKTNIGCHKILTLLTFLDHRFIYIRRVYNLRSLSIMSITKANS